MLLDAEKQKNYRGREVLRSAGLGALAELPAKVRNSRVPRWDEEGRRHHEAAARSSRAAEELRARLIEARADTDRTKGADALAVKLARADADHAAAANARSIAERRYLPARQGLVKQVIYDCGAEIRQGLQILYGAVDANSRIVLDQIAERFECGPLAPATATDARVALAAIAVLMETFGELANQAHEVGGLRWTWGYTWSVDRALQEVQRAIR